MKWEENFFGGVGRELLLTVLPPSNLQQETGTQPGIPHGWVQGRKHMGHLLLLLQVHWQGAGLGAEQLGLDPVFI